MVKEPIVSVLMVTYNTSEYIREAIESVLSSTYRNLEVIISDDCSKDNTWEIINEYRDSRIKAYRNDKNIGEYPNRNLSLHKASGKYIIFIDGDDTIYKDGIEMAVSHMELFSDNVAFGVARPQNENYCYPLLINSHDAYYKHYFERSLFNLSFSRNIFNTNILKKEGGLPKNFISGDTAIRLKLASKYNILIIDDLLGKWRKRKGQASESLNNSRTGVLEPYLINLQFINYKFCPLNEFEKKRARRIIKQKLFMHSLLSLKRRRLGLAFTLLNRAIFN